jgi:hypothetical protein
MPLPWNESRQGSSQLHYECYLFLPTIIQIVPWHAANAPFQLTYILAKYAI